MCSTTWIEIQNIQASYNSWSSYPWVFSFTSLFYASYSIPFLCWQRVLWQWRDRQTDRHSEAPSRPFYHILRLDQQRKKDDTKENGFHRLSFSRHREIIFWLWLVQRLLWEYVGTSLQRRVLPCEQRKWEEKERD